MSQALQEYEFLDILAVVRRSFSGMKWGKPHPSSSLDTVIGCCFATNVFIYLNSLIIKYILKMILDMDNVKENNNYIWLGDWEAATQ